MPFYPNYYRRRSARGARMRMIHRPKVGGQKHRKVTLARQLMFKNQTTHYFKRKFVSQWAANFGNAPAATNGTLTWLFSSTIRLSDISNPGDFTGLFDSYRINGVKIDFLHGYNTGTMNEEGNTAGTDPNLLIGVPTIYIVNDINDSSMPAADSDVLERPKCKTLYLDGKRSYYFKPRVDRLVSDGATNYQLVNMNDKPYLDMDNQDVIHNGLKVAAKLPYRNISTSAINIEITFPLLITYFLELRNPK